MTISFDYSPQGSPEWLAARKGVITGSQFKTCRDKTAKGAMTATAELYAMDTARERVGGTAASVFVNAAMRLGTEHEPMARMAYEALTGNLVEEVGFAVTEDRKFGCSVDGLVGIDGMVEIKTMVSSKTLFTAVVDGDHSAYIDQINGALWLLGLKWCDLILWAPDLPPAGQLTVVRINRDENAIQALEDDMVAFERTVCAYESKLRAKLAAPAKPAAPTAPDMDAPWALPGAPINAPALTAPDF